MQASGLKLLGQHFVSSSSFQHIHERSFTQIVPLRQLGIERARDNCKATKQRWTKQGDRNIGVETTERKYEQRK